MTADRAGYLNLPQPNVSSDPKVTRYVTPDGRIVPVIELEPHTGLTIHVTSEAGACALAAAFTQAADMIAGGGAS